MIMANPLELSISGNSVPSEIFPLEEKAAQELIPPQKLMQTNSTTLATSMIEDEQTLENTP
jgi:hypothetical protein